TLNQCEVPAFIDPDGIAAPCAKPANVGNADIKGLELEAEWYITEIVSVAASWSALDFEYTSVNTVALTGSPINPLDMITPYTPETKWSLGVQLTMPATDLGQIRVRGDTSFQDDIYTSPTNTPLDHM